MRGVAKKERGVSMLSLPLECTRRKERTRQMAPNERMPKGADASCLVFALALAVRLGLPQTP
jgi:hypothetical protein